MIRAVEKLRGTNANLLTPVHADLMYVCLKAHHYRAAIAVLDVPVFSIDPKVWRREQEKGGESREGKSEQRKRTKK